jgi:hypothetical protein
MLCGVEDRRKEDRFCESKTQALGISIETASGLTQKFNSSFLQDRREIWGIFSVPFHVIFLGRLFTPTSKSSASSWACIDLQSAIVFGNIDRVNRRYTMLRMIFGMFLIADLMMFTSL